MRVGGNATNFSVVTNNYMSNMYIGGEANNVSVLTPNGARNFYFGKGFDTTTIYTHSIENLYANRGSLNSTIHSERQVGDMMIGGDVANGTFLSGYTLGLASAASTVQSNLASASSSGTPWPRRPSRRRSAQASGAITAFIAGNVTNSVFAASVLPFSQVLDGTTQTFGEAQARRPLARRQDHRESRRLDRQLDGDARVAQDGVLRQDGQSHPCSGHAAGCGRAAAPAAHDADQPPGHSQCLPAHRYFDDGEGIKASEK